MMFAFDLDGTLITCRERHCSLMEQLLSTDIAVDRNSFWASKREGFSTLKSLVQCGVEEKRASVLAKKWADEIEYSKWQRLDKLIVKVSLLKEIGDAVIITARKDSPRLFESLEILGLTSCFQSIYVVEPGNAINEKAEALRDCSADFFVGDTEIDFHAAVESTTRFFAVETGMRSGSYLRRLMGEPGLIFENVNEILRQYILKEGEFRK